ncbi:MAG: gamma-glutamyl-gamma-aminobutyrate hydrolase family protein, partial [Gammaproteobacteria bacterium]|nr:gamma-glutamyl-gamma-aminobutyrate hydrolase family protein [Gammaproteobacteria bacterium]
NLTRYRGLIVLGGPMNVEDRHKLPHLQAELQAIRSAVAAGKPVLGICLGAQLLAHALGGDVRPNGQSELGWHNVATTEAGASDPVLAPLGRLDKVFQWHGHTFEVPEGAQLLATGDVCRNQAFRYGENAYGFQFHLEVDGALVNRWLELPGHQPEIAAAGPASGKAVIRDQTGLFLQPMQAVAEDVFNNFLDLVGRPARHIHHPSR